MIRIFSIVHYILDIIFPRGKRRADSFDVSRLLSSLPPEELALGFIHCLFRYQDPAVKVSVWQLKYYGNKKATAIYGEMLFSYLLEQISDEAIFHNFTKPLVLPIPLSKERRAKRGFNQCEIVIDFMKTFDRENQFEISYDLLIKARHTEEQKTLRRKDRLKNLCNIFLISDPMRIRGRNVIIFDDVCTTGATLLEARRTLLRAGARSVICTALAH